MTATATRHHNDTRRRKPRRQRRLAPLDAAVVAAVSALELALERLDDVRRHTADDGAHRLDDLRGYAWQLSRIRDDLEGSFGGARAPIVCAANRSEPWAMLADGRPMTAAQRKAAAE